MASTHDIQELDVSAILATQILTWIDDDEAEAKRFCFFTCCIYTRCTRCGLFCSVHPEWHQFNLFTLYTSAGKRSVGVKRVIGAVLFV